MSRSSPHIRGGNCRRAWILGSKSSLQDILEDCPTKVSWTMLVRSCNLTLGIIGRLWGASVRKSVWSDLQVRTWLLCGVEIHQANCGNMEKVKSYCNCSCEKWQSYERETLSNLTSILKIEPTVFADGLEYGGGERGRDPKRKVWNRWAGLHRNISLENYQKRDVMFPWTSSLLSPCIFFSTSDELHKSLHSVEA